MRKIFTLISAICLTTVSAMGATYGLDQKLTSLDSLSGKAFAIVNETASKALHGTNAQNLGYSDYADAFSDSNSGFVWKAVKDDTENAYYLQLVTPDGKDYICWSNGGVLNSQGAPQGYACSFILGTNNQKGQDIANGALYELVSTDNGWTIKNVGTGMYQPYSNGAANSTEATYWGFYTLKVTGADPEPEKITVPESLQALIDAKTVFTLKNGDNYVYGPDQQNLAVGTWEQASSAQNNANGYVLEADDYYYYFRAVKSDGSNISAWGANPCWLNNNGGNVVFNMRKDQDKKNGSSWLVTELEGGKYTIESVNQPGKYLAVNNTSGTLSETAAEWEFYVPAPKPDITISIDEEKQTITFTPEDTTAYYMLMAQAVGDMSEEAAQAMLDEMPEEIDSKEFYDMLGTAGFMRGVKTFTFGMFGVEDPGEYAVMAGCLYWDGEKCVAGKVAYETFTIAAPAPALVVTPAEGAVESLASFTIAVEDGLMLMAAGTDGKTITLYKDTAVVKSWGAEELTAINPVLDEEFMPIGLTLELDSAITAVGTYSLVISDSVFYIGEEMVANDKTSFSYEVKAPAPVPAEITPASGSTVDSIFVITVKDVRGITVNSTDGFSIFKGMDFVCAVPAANIVAETVEAGQKSTYVTITLPEAIKAAGTYQLLFPSGIFKIGEEESGNFVVEYTIEGEPQPVAGPALASSEFTAQGGQLVFDQFVAFADWAESLEATVTCKSAEKADVAATLTLDDANWSAVNVTFAEALGAGTYVLTVPAGKIIDGDLGETSYAGGEIEFTIEETDGISNLQIATLKDGKFMINGQLVIVKNGRQFNAAGMK